tara:strand:+ start:1007 stop:2002 length:996 start_codon:yes stop_codon:yes gene_type:complete
MKIFISIASYQDPLLESTIRSAFDNAKEPQNLIFGICDQSHTPINLNLFTFTDQIKYEHIDPVNSQGPCWARSRIQKLFDNEDYYLQIDSHMQFQKNWDNFLLNYIDRIRKINRSSHQLPIISSYPRSFKIIDFESKKFELNDQEKNTNIMTFREDSMFQKGNYCGQVGSFISSNDISHGYLLAAGALFTSKEFVKQVPYDPKLYFYGEEMSLMLRAFTRGFSIFHLPSVPIFHFYTDVEDIQRPLHWDENEDKKREIKWHQREENGIDRLNQIINNKINGDYGLGKIRNLKDFEHLSGVDLINKVVTNKEKAFTGDFLKSIPWNKSPLNL